MNNHIENLNKNGLYLSSPTTNDLNLPTFDRNAGNVAKLAIGDSLKVEIAITR